DAAQASKLWGAGMAASVKTLRHFTSRVVVLRDNPQAPWDIPACVSWDPSTPTECDFPGLPAGSDAAEYAAERKAGVPGDVYSNPTPAVCPAAICPAEVGGEITYRDDNHLTAAYVATRWRQFAASLNLSFARRTI